MDTLPYDDDDDIKKLFQAVAEVIIAEKRRIFIDSSKRSLKAVLLHNSNEIPPISIADSAQLKESYDNTG